MLSILWKHVPQLVCFSSKGVSPSLGVELPSGYFSHGPSFFYCKRQQAVNPNSSFQDYSGFYKPPAQLCQSRLGVLSLSVVAVFVNTCAPWCSAPLSSSSSFCFSRQKTRTAPSTRGTWVLWWPHAVFCFGLYSSHNHSPCFSDLCWTRAWHFQTFLCDNLEIFSLCGNSQLRAQHVFEIRFVYSHYIPLQISTLILMTFYCPVILNCKILLISSQWVLVL